MNQDQQIKEDLILPIKIDDKSMSFSDAVEHVKRTKPDVKSPGGFVKSIEEKQNAKLLASIRERANLLRLMNGI